MNVGYARVSTGEQNLDLQLDALEGAGCQVVYKDEGLSGTLSSRPGLEQALEALQAGDTLIVWRLDRLGRSLHHLIETIDALSKRNIQFKSLNESIDTTTPGGELLFHIMGALAQFESRLISERSRAGMDAAKRRGKHVGRPPSLSPEQVAHAREMVERGEKTLSAMAELYNVDRSTLHRALRNQRGNYATGVLQHLKFKNIN